MMERGGSLGAERAVRLTERMSFPDQSDSLRVVHAKTHKDNTENWGETGGVRVIELAFGVDVDEAFTCI
jgi:hypothetical protein